MQATGVGAGDRVGVCLQRSLDLVVMLLAVLKVGVGYPDRWPTYDGLEVKSGDAYARARARQSP